LKELEALIKSGVQTEILLECWQALPPREKENACRLGRVYCRRHGVTQMGVLSGHGRLYNEWKYNGADLTACVQLATLAATLAALALATTRQQPCVLFTTQRKTLAMLTTSEGAATTNR
jgi:hypothetical protein